MQDFINVYARTFMVAARMEPFVSREVPVARGGRSWLLRLVGSRRPA